MNSLNSAPVDSCSQLNLSKSKSAFLRRLGIHFDQCLDLYLTLQVLKSVMMQFKWRQTTQVSTMKLGSQAQVPAGQLRREGVDLFLT